ncbi:unnamed protein product, partial [Iphiclides podalirius]
MPAARGHRSELVAAGLGVILRACAICVARGASSGRVGAFSALVGESAFVPNELYSLNARARWRRWRGPWIIKSAAVPLCMCGRLVIIYERINFTVTDHRRRPPLRRIAD